MLLNVRARAQNTRTCIKPGTSIISLFLLLDARWIQENPWEPVCQVAWHMKQQTLRACLKQDGRQELITEVGLRPPYMTHTPNTHKQGQNRKSHKELGLLDIGKSNALETQYLSPRLKLAAITLFLYISES